MRYDECGKKRNLLPPLSQCDGNKDLIKVASCKEDVQDIKVSFLITFDNWIN